MTPQPSTSGHDSSDEFYRGHDSDSDSDDVSGSTYFYDDSSEASSSQEPGSSDEGYSDDNYTEFTISGDDSSDDDIPTLPPGVDFMTGVGGVRLEAEYIYNGSSPSSVGESIASLPHLDNQGEQDEEKEERKIEDPLSRRKNSYFRTIILEMSEEGGFNILDDRVLAPGWRRKDVGG